MRPGKGTARGLASLRGRRRSWEKQVGPAQGSRIRTAGKRANAKWGPASLPTPCRRTSIRLASPKRRPRPLVSAACSTRAANGPRLRISVTGVGRDTLAGLNAATSGGQLDNQAETRQSRLGHSLRITFHPLPGGASPVFTANVLSCHEDGKERLGTSFRAVPPSLRFRDGGLSCSVRHSPRTMNGFLAAPFHNSDISFCYFCDFSLPRLPLTVMMLSLNPSRAKG